MEPFIILVETMGPANIGSVARSVAAYGLSNLRLVSPRCEVDDETRQWACYGKRVLERIQYFDTLDEALKDVNTAVALSRRDGKNRHRHFSLPRLQTDAFSQLSSPGQIAYVFGNEESGLSREHLALCHFSAEIPVVADDGSLNLAHAVTATLYEMLGRDRAPIEAPAAKNEHEELATPEHLLDLLNRCEETLSAVGYPRHRSSLPEELAKLQTIMSRSKLENWEVRLLMGMLKQVRYRLENPESKES